MLREEADLRQIGEMCDSNLSILTDRISAAEKLIRDLKAPPSQGSKWQVPEADKLVVATTVVHNQLYDLVTEDMAIEDALYVLGRALDRERVGLDVWMKNMRILAREQFLCRALVRKIVRGMGLDGV